MFKFGDKVIHGGTMGTKWYGTVKYMLGSLVVADWRLTPKGFVWQEGVPVSEVEHAPARDISPGVYSGE